MSSNQEQEAAGVAVLGKRVRQEEASQDCSGVGADAHGKMRFVCLGERLQNLISETKITVEWRMHN